MLVLKKLSIWDLISIAVTSSRDEDDGDYWVVIWELRKRASRKIYKIARRFCHSSDLEIRLVGIDILAQLGYVDYHPFHKKRLRLLLKLIEGETDPEMLNNLAISLGHFHDKRANPALLMLKNHPDREVRFAVAFGLRVYDNDLKAVDALIELSTDSDTEVRSWATFGLGTRCDLNTEAIRDTLFARLSDSDEETRGEAMVGLARRKDQRVFAPLLAELEGTPDWMLPLDAAEELADPRLLPALLRFQEQWTGEKDWIYSCLQNAVVACGGNPDANERKSDAE